MKNSTALCVTTAIDDNIPRKLFTDLEPLMKGNSYLVKKIEDAVI